MHKLATSNTNSINLFFRGQVWEQFIHKTWCYSWWRPPCCWSTGRSWAPHCLGNSEVPASGQRADAAWYFWPVDITFISYRLKCICYAQKSPFCNIRAIMAMNKWSPCNIKVYVPASPGLWAGSPGTSAVSRPPNPVTGILLSLTRFVYICKIFSHTRLPVRSFLINKMRAP